MKKFFWIKYILAGRDKEHESVLRRLARDHDENIRRRVAENCDCPKDVLEALARDTCTDVRIAVALNRKANRPVYNNLCKDPSPDVRFMIASTSYMPVFLLRKLATDENPYVQERAIRTITLKMEARKRFRYECN